MKKHTPLPWKAVDMRDGVYTIRSGEQIVATVHHIGIEPSERVPNAHLIEDAVNHHEELVEALKLAYDTMNYMGDIMNEMDIVSKEDEERTGPAFDAVRAALAKLEVQP